MKSTLLLFAIIPFLFISCKKEDDPKVTDGLFLKQITYVNGNTKTEQFDYSSDGLLVKHQIMFNGFADQYEDFFYAKGRLDHSAYYLYDYSNEKYRLQYKRSYELDKNGKISIFIEEEVPSGKFNYAQFYYLDGKIDSIAFQVVDESYHTTIEGYYLLTTDVVGNIITSKKKLLDQPDIYPLIGYRYDGKNNPLKGMVNPTDFITFFPAANLVMDQSSTYSYQYNEENLPVSRNQRYGQAPLDTVSMAVGYEYGGI